MHVCGSCSYITTMMNINVIPHIIQIFQCSEVVLQVSIGYILQDEHHWEGGGDTAKHLQDMKTTESNTLKQLYNSTYYVL